MFARNFAKSTGGSPSTIAKSAAVAALCAALLLPGALLADPVDWTQYEYSFTITFPGYTSSATLSDFPVLIRISAARNAFRYSKCKVANGGDLRFSDESGNLLASEIDTWNPNGESLVWVKVPTFNKNTTIKAHYGCSSPAEVNPKDVWSNGYVGVWHLNESARPLRNSTATTDIDFTRSNDSNSSPGYYDERIAFAQEGAVGGSVKFDTITDSANAKWRRGGLLAYDPDGKLSGFDAISIEIWEKVESFDDAYDRYMLCKRSTTGDKLCPYNFYIPTTLRPTAVMRLEGNMNCFVAAWQNYMTQSHAGAWNFHCAQYDKNATIHTNYLNGACIGTRSDASATTGQPLISDDAPLCLGNYTLPSTYNSGKPTVFNGALDELRISNVARSNPWVKATYDTVHNPDFTYCEIPNDWNLYSHKFAVTFPGAPETALADFPVLVKVSTNSIPGFLYTDCRKLDGGDLRFSDSEGNLLASEVDTWDPDGESLLWAQVPSPSATTVITAYYGNEFAPVVDTKAVWSNGYAGVWHLNESARPLRNSTATTGVDFTRSNNSSSDPGHYDDCIGFAQSGAVGKSVKFSAYTGDDEAMRVRGGLIAYDPQNKLCGFNAISLEIWAKVDAIDTTGQRFLLARRVTVGSAKLRPYNVTYNKNRKAGAAFGLDNGLDDAKSDASHSSAAMPESLDGSWNYHCFQYDNTATYHTNYLNGAYSARTSNNTGYSILAPPAESFICLGNDNAPSSAYSTNPPQVFNGAVDELRISNVARSPEWVKATYDTIKNNATFTTYGAARENGRKGLVVFIR